MIIQIRFILERSRFKCYYVTVDNHGNEDDDNDNNNNNDKNQQQ